MSEPLPPEEEHTRLVEERAPVEETLVVPPRRRPPLLWPYLLAVLLAALAILGAAFALTRDSGEESSPTTTAPPVALVEVPLIVGLKEPVARDRLAEAGLQGKRVAKPSTKPAGVVLAQEPLDGEEVPKGSVVAYTVSSGPPKVAVPKVVGAPEAEAIAALRAAKLKAKVVRRPSDKPAGVVTGQAPKAGAKAPRGSVVTLVVSNGEPPAPVPDVVGLAASEAVQVLRSAGFEVALHTVPGGGPSGTVVAQDPPGGAKAKPDRPVRLNVVAGGAQTTPSSTTPAQTTPAQTTPAQTSTTPQAQPQNVEVPDVTGRPLADAADTLAAAGLRAYVRYIVSAEPKGTVVEQAKEPGTQVRRGSSVGVNVSSGPNQEPGAAQVPNVTGMKFAEGRQALIAAGFEVRSYEVQSDPSKRGVILEHQPRGRAPQGALVLLYVGA
jgi:beta-lactam-binding protein with PASTA domain